MLVPRFHLLHFFGQLLQLFLILLLFREHLLVLVVMMDAFRATFVHMMLLVLPVLVVRAQTRPLGKIFENDLENVLF